MVARRFALLVAVAVAIVVASGCGSSDSDKAKQTVTTYLGAIASGDGEKACDQLTGDAKRQLLQSALDQLPELQITSCADAIHKLAENLGADEKQTLKDANVKRVKVTGDYATVAIQGATRTAKLTRNGSGWLIAEGVF